MNSNDGTCLCSKCRASINLENAREVRDRIICTDCISEMLERDSFARPVKSPRSISKFLLFIFALIPGAGYMYLGLMRKGVIAMTLLFISPILVNFLWWYGILFYVPILTFYCFFDSFAIRRKMLEDAEFHHIR